MSPETTRADDDAATTGPDHLDGSAVVVLTAREPGRTMVAAVTGLRSRAIEVVVVDLWSGPAWQVTFDRCELLGAQVLHCGPSRSETGALHDALALVGREHPGVDVVVAGPAGSQVIADIEGVRAAVAEHVPPAHEGAGCDCPLVVGVRTESAGSRVRRLRRRRARARHTADRLRGPARGEVWTGPCGLPASRLAWAREAAAHEGDWQASLLARAARDGIDVVSVPLAPLSPPSTGADRAA